MLYNISLLLGQIQDDSRFKLVWYISMPFRLTFLLPADEMDRGVMERR